MAAEAGSAFVLGEKGPRSVLVKRGVVSDDQKREAAYRWGRRSSLFPAQTSSLAPSQLRPGN